MITALTLAPVAAALLILALPEARARAVALAGALVSPMADPQSSAEEGAM